MLNINYDIEQKKNEKNKSIFADFTASQIANLSIAQLAIMKTKDILGLSAQQLSLLTDENKIRKLHSIICSQNIDGKNVTDKTIYNDLIKLLTNLSSIQQKLALIKLFAVNELLLLPKGAVNNFSNVEFSKIQSKINFENIQNCNKKYNNNKCQDMWNDTSFIKNFNMPFIKDNVIRDPFVINNINDTKIYSNDNNNNSPANSIQNNQIPNYFVIDSIDGGVNIQDNIEATDVECANKCDNLKNCIGFSYNNNHCWLKSNVDNPVANSDSSLYVKNNEADKINVGYYQIMNKTDSPSSRNLPIQMHNSTANQCSDYCINNPNCIGFVRNDNGTCWFKSEWNGNTNTSNDDTSYIKPIDNNLQFKPTLDISTYKLVKNFDYPGNDLLNFDGTDQDCIKKCNNTQNCMGFIYKNNHCWLKTKMDKPNESRDDNNRYFAFIKNDKLSSVSPLLNYNIYPYFDSPTSNNLYSKNEKNYSPSECAVICNNEPKCIGFVRENNRGECWLKSEWSNLANGNNGYTSFLKNQLDDMQHL